MKLKDAYDEACKCGYPGSFLDWVKSVGVTVKELDSILDPEIDS